MNNGQFTKTIIQMQYVPRWSEHAPRYRDSAASHSFRCAALAVLVGLIHERVLQQPLDRLELTAKALLHDLNETETGSIKHVTKKDARVSDHIRAFERDVNTRLVTYLSNSVRPFFRVYIEQAEDASPTGRLVDAIDSFDAMMFCHRESMHDTNPYFHRRYEQLREEMRGCPLPAIAWLAEEYDKREGVFEFCGHLLNLDNIERWNGNFNLVPDNDATHSFRVAALALFNGLLERERFGREGLDVDRLLSKAILHDVSESLSGDVKGTFKHSQPAVKQAFEAYEHELALRIVHRLPEALRTDMEGYMVAKDGTYEGDLVDVTDKLDALIKANLEMRNNPHYAKTYYEQLTMIQRRFEQPCVIFFLAYILHDLTYASFVR
ncbi:HD domain-containing protein [Paenibacillus sp. IB182496]|uniref:HD domain-containing protein n=1 Tax=Paenibacillus sabuli TaxID=2772509 RepID=A0A927GSE2_9BACL|nr:YfbR-like 5'-deoxynucleotidase [Paenibacillus sabuli]MBD2846468.1 HD domain-containing protein [Paenibacillus sabuli]